MEGPRNPHQHLVRMQARPSAFQKFKANPLAMAGSLFILLIALICLLGPWIRPDQSPDANEQHLVLAKLKPGTQVDFICIRKQNQPNVSFLRMWWEGGAESNWIHIPIDSIYMRDHKVHVHPLDISDAGITANGFNPTELRAHVGEGVEAYRFQNTYLAGTDTYGRDLLSRLMAGASVSLSVGTVPGSLSLLI